MIIRKRLIMAGIILNMGVLSGCGQILNAGVGAKVQGEETGRPEESVSYEITDKDRRTEASGQVEINLSQLADDGIVTENYSYTAGTLIIYKGGDYMISGKADNCNLVIRAYDDETVHLFLNQAQLHAQTGPVLYGEQAGKIIITLKEGTENLIYDDTEYAADAEACIFSNCDLTINGSGSLSVYGYYHDAVRSKDRIKIIETNLYIRAKNNGIRGNDGVIIEGSRVEAECEGTGILTNSEQAYVAVTGGELKITAGENAIRADRYVSIQDCLSDLYSAREAVRCNGWTDIDGDSAK